MRLFIIVLLLTGCTVAPRAELCDVPNILPQVQNPPLTLEHWHSACVIVGIKAHVASLTCSATAKV